MKTITQKLKLLFICSTLFLVSSFVNAQFLATNLPDYAPNSTAIISGFGFQAGESITLQVTYADGSPLSSPYNASWVVTADAGGDFITTWYVCFCPWSHLVATANGNAGSYADIYFTDSGVDFNQAANQGHPTTPISWINGILNVNNSDYFEGIGVPQRVILFGLSGSSHSMNFSHQATKSGVHAYDFLMSWSQAVATAAAIGNGSTNELLNLFAQTCSDNNADCNTLTSPPINSIAVSAPDIMLTGSAGLVDTGIVQPRIRCFENIYGNRTIEIIGNAAVTAGSILFTGYTQSGSDYYANYTISWTSTADKIMIRMAGRSAQGDAACGYGAGLGSGSISGGPYHFKLGDLDGSPLGSQDNQIQASATAPPIENCSVSVSPNSTICDGGTVTLTATPVGGSPPYTYLWSNAQTSASINVSPNTTTTYTVTITDSQLSECSSSAAVTVSSVPVCSIDPASSSICQGQASATLTASGGGTYLWSTGSTNASITASPNSNTTYTVTVTNTEGCSSSCSRLVVVNQLPSCNISPASPSICIGQASATLTASGGGTYLWSTGSTNAAITVSPNSSTTYTVTVTSADGCTSSCSRTVAVNQLPSCNISPASSAICQGQASATLTASGGGTYLWSTGSTNASITVSPNSNTTYTVTVTSAQGCTSSCSRSVIVNPVPSCNISPASSSICQGQGSATLTASGGGTYLWSTGSTNASITVSPNSNTTYTVTVTSAEGCTSSCSRSVVVNPVPSCNISPSNPTICGGDQVTLTASGGGTYLWSTGSTNSSITVSPNSTTSYTVTITSTAGCTSSCSRTVNVTTPPTCSITGPTFLCLGGPPISLTASGGNNCSWIGPNNFTSNNCTIGPFSQMSQSGTYTVTVSNGNCTSTCSQSIVIIPCDDNHCGFTQGYYGNLGGRDCDQLTTTEILTNALSSPLVIGCGGNILTLTSADVSCLIGRLPGGGKAVTISGNNTCSSLVGIPTFSNGRFRDILLSQTITLSLNTRYDPSLTGVQLTGTYMTTVKASDCSVDAVPVPNTIAVYAIPPSVLTYLGANNTIQDLLNLANDALCGAYTPGVGDPTLGDISKAEDALNRGFDECRFLVGFSNTLREATTVDNTNSFTVAAYPNPFSSVTSIAFTAGNANSDVTVEVYNSTGSKVATLFNGPTEQGVSYKVDFDGTIFPAGIYLYRISNDVSVFTDKLILIK